MTPSLDHEAGASAPRRKISKQSSQPLRRASVACVTCRDRRVKCDGDSGPRGSAKPCSQCKQANRSCTFRFDDRRKISSSKAYVQQLQERIAALERRQPSSIERTSSEASPSASIRTAEEDSAWTSIPDTFVDSDALGATDQQYDQNNLFQIILDQQSIARDFGLKSPTPISSAICGTILPMASKMGLMKGTLSSDENGQSHYFGYTSNLQVVSFLPHSPTSSTTLPTYSKDDDLEHLADSEAIRTHLLELYFTYHHPAVPILDEETFRGCHAIGVKSQFYSLFLLYAILLRSIRLSTKSGIRSLAAVYLHRAKAELLSELEQPTISTIQALCIFGHYLGSTGNDRACWLYPGIAFRLVHDFGLHQDPTDLIREGQLTEKENKVRHVTLWGCYTIDKLYSSFHGRPTALRFPDIAVPLPTLATVGPQHHLLSAWVQLSIILDDIISVINGPIELLDHPSTLSTLSEASLRLLQFLKSLPSELEWSPSTEFPSSGVCALHIQFLATTILLHRPFAACMLGSEVSKSGPKRQLDGYTPQVSQHICTVNAMRIARMLQAFRRHYGIEKMFSTVVYVTMTSALSLITEISMGDSHEDKSAEIACVKICFEVLDDLAPSTPVAGRNHTILRSIMQYCGCSDLVPPPANVVEEVSSKQLHQRSRLPRESSITSNQVCPPDIEHEQTNTWTAWSDIQPEFDTGLGYADFNLPDFLFQPMGPMDLGRYGSDALFGLEQSAIYPDSFHTVQSH
ncbi:uncharacterized protein BDZ99DRAFT_503848 [Mytilinidion resinicola]|uniref:Zn(2)-C6 fungal-type domain-containing protein n=1 Tax=Mytilinidion resinicola TaxID=574789 RepID=A0A6A6Y0N3_9PEZI|nr:uncharacterized protein BDZ99DRAFT_503848 [Mytilinidion resinicola]KAF2802371.1 hypothetical protein BDZ99DRAFT_503848 [Mytilinidion resinicola]